MSNTRSLRSRARLRHLLSYLLISMLPVLLCGILLSTYTYARRTEQVDTAALDGLTLFSNTYSALLDSMDACAGHLADNLLLYDAQGYESLPSQLRSYQSNYTLFTCVLFYAKGDDSIYTSDGRVNYHQFESNFALTYGVDCNMTNLFTAMNNAVTGTALRSRALKEGSANGEYLFYLRTVPALDAKPKGVVVYVVAADTLRALLADCAPSDYSLYMYTDQYLTWLFRSNTGEEGDRLQESLNRLTPSGETKAELYGREYLLLRVKSQADGMYHMLAYDCEALYSDCIADRNRSLATLILLCVPVGLAAYLLHRYMYMPIDTLLDLPLPQDTDTVEGNADGADDLLGGVAVRARRMIDQNEKLQEQIEDQRAIMRAKLAISLIASGAQEDEQFSALALNAGVHPFPYHCFTVAYIEADGEPEVAPSGALEYSEKGMWIYVVPMRSAGQFALLPNHEGAAHVELSNAVLSALGKAGIVPSKAGLGLTQSVKERVPVSLIQAQAVAAANKPDSPIASFEDDAGHADLTGFLPFSGKMLLGQCIRNGQKEIALSTMHQMRADLMPLFGSSTIQRSWCFFLFDAICETIRELHMEDLLQDMTDADLLYLTQDDFFEKLERIVGHACDRVSSQEIHILEEKQSAMLDYVNEHFREQDMSLTRLRESFQLSESYITRFFKQTTGQSFLQYVSQRRMDWVRAQLTDTDKPIKDIGNEAGYADIANFTRKFRQAEGVTPSIYRQQRRMANL